MKTVTLLITGLVLSSCAGGAGGGAAAVASGDVAVVPACPLPANPNGLATSNLVDDVQFFGDELATGQASCDTSETDKVTKGYAGKTTQMLGSTLDNRATVNSGITQQLTAVQTYGTRYTRIKVLMPGYNDALVATSITDFKSKLNSAITIMAANSYFTSIATIPYSYGDGVRSNAAIDAYNQAIRDVVTAMNLANVRVIDINAAMGQNPVNFNSDKVTFNKAGSLIIAQSFYNVLRWDR